VPAAEHGVEASQRNAGDDLGAVFIRRPAVAAGLGHAGQVADGSTTISGDEKAEHTSG